MNTIARGNAAEAAVVYALVVAGIDVLVPFGDGSCFDQAAVRPIDEEIVRIQVKSGRVRKGCVEFNASSTDHGRGQLHYRGRADLIAVHVASRDRLFIVPVDDCPSFKGYLRLDTPRNNQQKRIRLADRYDFVTWARSVGSTTARQVAAPALLDADADRDHR